MSGGSRGTARLQKLGRFELWAALAALHISVSTATRLVLFGVAWTHGQAGRADLPPVLGIGLGFDLATALYLFVPLAAYLVVVPDRIYRARWHRGLLVTMTALTAFGLIYLGAVEYFFFDEFNSRFNFVAVEYLIYPHEVFVNIWDSYPVARVLLATATATALTMWLLRGTLRRAGSGTQPLQRRLAFGAVLALLLSGVQVGLNINSGRFSENRVVNELAMNGVYSFFNAALNKELDYYAFYMTLPDEEADERLRQVVAPGARFKPYTDHIERRVTGRGAPRKLNVIVLLQESLGAEFVGAYGDKRGLTPNLDRIAAQSLMFDRAYATGTRTVRGMEAVTASFPPVPAESLVKRPCNEGLFNWSTIMAANGYSPTFIYGGYGTFDNMNHFFGSNGYRVVDRTDMDEPGFENIWGVSDEDLFRNAIRVFDGQHEKGERIFSVVMSTSNHKPFTYPPGVPGVPVSGGGREAGIRYADHAIGRFFEQARARPWFDDTLFVIVADHGARVYGREDIPVSTYEIPLLIYSPRHVRSGHVQVLTSQIDIAPTVLGMLHFSYDSTFFGTDVLREARPRRLIPLNHNRDVALFDGNHIVELGFRKTAAQFVYDRRSRSQTRESLDPERLKDTIAFFQEGYELYAEHLYRLGR
jgi:phosphoglycerol transferase MdoB-like AlkP superfamily enzyme